MISQQSEIHSDLMVRCRVTDAAFGSTSSSFCVNQSSGNITKLLEYKTHLLEICLSLLWNKMGETLLGGSCFSTSFAGWQIVVHVRSSSETWADLFGVGLLWLLSNCFVLWQSPQWILWFARVSISLKSACVRGEGQELKMHLWLSES